MILSLKTFERDHPKSKKNSRKTYYCLDMNVDVKNVK